MNTFKEYYNAQENCNYNSDKKDFYAQGLVEFAEKTWDFKEHEHDKVISVMGAGYLKKEDILKENEKVINKQNERIETLLGELRYELKRNETLTTSLNRRNIGL